MLVTIESLTFRKNSLKASLPTICAFARKPDSRRVSCRNLAMSSLTRRSLRSFSSWISQWSDFYARSVVLGKPRTAANLSSNVEGSMFGKSLSATGRRNSMKGTMMNTEKGTRRRISCVVRFNWDRSSSAHALTQEISRTKSRDERVPAFVLSWSDFLHEGSSTANAPIFGFRRRAVSSHANNVQPHA